MDHSKSSYAKTIVNNFDPSNSHFLIEHFGFEKTKKQKGAFTGSNLFSLHFITQGSLYLYENGQKVLLHKNTCFLISPEKSISYEPHPKSPATYYWVSVTGCTSNSFFQNIGFNNKKRYILLEPTFAKKVKDAFHKVFLVPTELSKLNYLYMYESLYRIAKYIFLSQYEKNRTILSIPSSYSQSMIQIMQYIQENYTDPELTLLSLSKKMYMHPDYLSTLFKKEAGITFKHYITQKRIHYADFLIHSGETNISLIAEKVGIPDASYFTRIYKKINLITPSQEINKYKKSLNNTSK